VRNGWQRPATVSATLVPGTSSENWLHLWASNRTSCSLVAVDSGCIIALGTFQMALLRLAREQVPEASNRSSSWCFLWGALGSENWLYPAAKIWTSLAAWWWCDLWVSLRLELL
jgi:hypothetical protein